MSSAKITLFTFAKYMTQHDDDLFSNLSLPEGIIKDTLVENILLRGGEFEVLYSDPRFMQYAIGTWSKKWYRTMQKWLEALAIDYNPLENYDRYESIQDKSEKTTTMDRTLNNQDENVINTQDLRTLDTDVLNTRNLMDEETRDLEDKETRDLTDVTTYDHDTEIEEQVSAYDSSSYQPSKVTYNKDSDSDHNTVTLDQDGTDTFEHTGKDIFNHTGYDNTKNTGTDRMNRTGTETAVHSGSINDAGGEDAFNNHSGHIHGNIGVTSSQDLLMQELSVNEWNIYEHITDLFLTEFVVPIYT